VVGRASQGAVSPIGLANEAAPAPARAAAVRELAFDSCSGGAESGMHASGNACALDDEFPQTSGTAWERVLAGILGRPAGSSAVSVSPTGSD
jgi:hypothetical protein